MYTPWRRAAATPPSSDEVTTSATFFLIEEAGIPTLVVTGRIGPGELQGFEKNLLELRTRAARCAIVNMTGCPYLPSMGIPPLIRMDNQLQEEGKKLLVAAEGELLEIFRVLRLDQKLLIHDSLDECVRSALVIAS